MMPGTSSQRGDATRKKGYCGTRLLGTQDCWNSCVLVDPHFITQMSATYEAVTAARTFSALTQTVFQATGWP